MTLDPVAAELIEAARASGRPNAHLLPINEARQNLSSFYAGLTRPEVHEVRDLVMSTPDYELPARLYHPNVGVPPLIVYFHGGGWLLGDINDFDPIARRIALATGCAVLSVEYRRGPEHRFPAAVDDSFAALLWAGQHGTELRVDVSRLIVAGDSAGGNLATVAAIRSRDEGGPNIRHQVLVYPVTTCDLNIGFDLEFEGLMLYRDEMQWHQDNYLTDPSQTTHPWVAPLTADLKGLPPTTIVLAECDPIGVQGRLYAQALLAAGVPVEVIEYPGMIHGFFGLDSIFQAGGDALIRVAAAISA